MKIFESHHPYAECIGEASSIEEAMKMSASIVQMHSEKEYMVSTIYSYPDRFVAAWIEKI